MRHCRSSSLLVALTVVALATPAGAQRGVDAELFHPALDGYGIFTVERGETAPRWSFGFKLYANYAASPLRLALFDADAMAPRSTNVIDRQIAVNLGGYLGLTDWLELAIDLPVSSQSFSAAYGSYGSAGDSTLARTGFYATAPYTNVPPPDASPLDARVALKARLVRASGFGVALAAVATLPFGDASAFLGDTSATFRPALIADWTRGRVTAAVNAGAVVRGETVVRDPHDGRALLDVGDELTWSAGLAVRFAAWGSLGAEAYGLVPLQHTASQPGDAGRDFTADVLGGLQLFPGHDVSIAVGAGANVLASALRHDDFRVFLGVAWAPASGGRGAVLSGSLDSDGDGIPDTRDLCPGEPEDRDGFQDEDGCPDPDNDGDGIPDRRDRCPNDPEDKDGFRDEDGCPDPDNDGDGVPDAADHCPNDAEDRDGFQDDDGCPDPDNDGDGILDAHDRCPNEPETRNGVDDDDGCPDTGGGGAPAEALERLRIPDRVTFERGSAVIVPRWHALLDHVADRINAHSEVVRIRVEGHADGSGSTHANRALAQARADAVRAYLIGRGVEPERLQAVGYGADRPIDRGRREEAHAKNRRVEFIVVEAAR